MIAAKNRQQPKPKNGNSARWGIAGAIVLTVAAALVMMRRKPEEPSAPREKARSRIAASSPVPKGGTEAVQPPKETPEELRRNGMWTDEDGNLRRRDGSYFFGKPNREKPMKVDLRSRHPEQTAFKRSSEIAIAHVLMITPGESIENWVKFGKRFNDDFRASLEEKIEILPDDDDYVKELKRAVIETKEELRQRMNAGEDVAEIINEARAELERLGRLREEIRRQVVDIAANDPDLTERDLRDLAQAADAMLKDKGLPPLSDSKMFMLQLKLSAMKAKGGNQ